MTDPNYTALVFVIDRSGSMKSIHEEVTGALNALRDTETAEPGKLTIDTVFFDGEYEERDHFASPDSADFTIEPRGMTALYDAVASKILSFGEALNALPEHERPSKILFVIATDGHENSSRRYNAGAVAELVEQQRSVYSWQFTFLGANQDAVLAAQQLNIPADDSITFSASSTGVLNVGKALSSYTRSYRSGGATGYTTEQRTSALAEEETVQPGSDQKHFRTIRNSEGTPIFNVEVTTAPGIEIPTTGRATSTSKKPAGKSTPRKRGAK